MNLDFDGMHLAPYQKNIRDSPSRNGTIGDLIQPPKYSKEAKLCWSKAFRDLKRKKYKKYLASSIKACSTDLALSHKNIPSLSELSKIMKNRTGFQIAKVGGLIPYDSFAYLLANSIFPSTDYIRPLESIGYTPEPDIIHDIIGHMPLLLNESYARLMKRYGELSLLALEKGDKDILDKLGKIYWFVVEFGLIREEGEIKIYGAGILSSINEIERVICLIKSGSERIKDFSEENLNNAIYDPHHLQEEYLVIEDFETQNKLLDQIQIALGK